MFNQRATDFCKQLKVRVPIIQAPMAGGTVTPLLLGEVTKHGGLGSLPLGYLSVDEARQSIRNIAALLPERQFAVNIFVPAIVPPAKMRYSAKTLKCSVTAEFNPALA